MSASVRFLSPCRLIVDAVSLVEGRPAAELAVRLFPEWPGSLAAGTLPV